MHGLLVRANSCNSWFLFSGLRARQEIEADEDYIRVALGRIDAVQPGPPDPDVFFFENKRTQPRVPFGTLLERGLLRPGQKLYFGRKGHAVATVLANGQLKWGKVTGSIHEIARAIQNAPCNGWEHWYYLDAEAGERVVIDKLREKAREQDNGKS